MDQPNPLVPRPVNNGGKNRETRIRNTYAPTEHGVQVLTGGHVRPNAELIAEKQELDEYNKRQRYAVLDVHREKAAVAVASGASNEMAAAFAGVSKRQVRKYMTFQAFRDRVLELRGQLMGRIEGRIAMEFLRRTEPENIRSMDNGELMRLLDRATGASRAKGGLAAINDGNTPETDKYEKIIVELTNIDARTQIVDFPSFESTDVQLPGSSSPVE